MIENCALCHGTDAKRKWKLLPSSNLQIVIKKFESFLNCVKILLSLCRGIIFVR